MPAGTKPTLHGEWATDDDEDAASAWEQRNIASKVLVVRLQKAFDATKPGSKKRVAKVGTALDAIGCFLDEGGEPEEDGDDDAPPPSRARALLLQPPLMPIIIALLSGPDGDGGGDGGGASGTSGAEVERIELVEQVAEVVGMLNGGNALCADGIATAAAGAPLWRTALRLIGDWWQGASPVVKSKTSKSERGKTKAAVIAAQRASIGASLIEELVNDASFEALAGAATVLVGSPADSGASAPADSSDADTKPAPSGHSTPGDKSWLLDALLALIIGGCREANARLGHAWECRQLNHSQEQLQPQVGAASCAAPPPRAPVTTLMPTLGLGPAILTLQQRATAAAALHMLVQGPPSGVAGSANRRAALQAGEGLATSISLLQLAVEATSAAAATSRSGSRGYGRDSGRSRGALSAASSKTSDDSIGALFALMGISDRCESSIMCDDNDEAIGVVDTVAGALSELILQPPASLAVPTASEAGAGCSTEASLLEHSATTSSGNTVTAMSALLPLGAATVVVEMTRVILAELSRRDQQAEEQSWVDDGADDDDEEMHDAEDNRESAEADAEAELLPNIAFCVAAFSHSAADDDPIAQLLSQPWPMPVPGESDSDQGTTFCVGAKLARGLGRLLRFILTDAEEGASSDDDDSDDVEGNGSAAIAEHAAWRALQRDEEESGRWAAQRTLFAMARLGSVQPSALEWLRVPAQDDELAQAIVNYLPRAMLPIGPATSS